MAESKSFASCSDDISFSRPDTVKPVITERSSGGWLRLPYESVIVTTTFLTPLLCLVNALPETETVVAVVPVIVTAPSVKVVGNAQRARYFSESRLVGKGDRCRAC